MSITFTQTAREVVAGALRDMGIVALGRDPKAHELAYGVEQLNLLMKELAADGIAPWSASPGVALFAAGVAEVTLSPRPVEVSEARVLTGYFRLLRRLGAGEYEAYPNQTQPGTPVAYDIRHTPAGVAMRVWPVPNVAMDVHYSYTRALEDADPSQPLDLPQIWGSAIREMLKARLTAFGAVDPMVEARAEMMKRRLIDFGRPESYTLFARP